MTNTQLKQKAVSIRSDLVMFCQVQRTQELEKMVEDLIPQWDKIIEKLEEQK